MDESNTDALRALALTAFKAGDYDVAIERFDALVAVSHHPFDNGWRTLTLQLLGRYDETCDELNLILRANPDDTFALHHLGRIKACCEDPSLRDGALAVRLSTRLCEISEWKNWEHLSVLSAAHAEVGDWELAQRFASLALELAPDDEKPRREARLNQYREHCQFRSSRSTDHSLIIYPEAAATALRQLQ